MRRLSLILATLACGCTAEELEICEAAAAAGYGAREVIRIVDDTLAEIESRALSEADPYAPSDCTGLGAVPVASRLRSRAAVVALRSKDPRA